jgi:hypothetical protein
MKARALSLAVIVLLFLSSCASEPISSDLTGNEYKNSTVIGTTGAESIQNDPNINIDELKEKYPEYFEMSDFKGIEVYVWQMVENSYRCGMMSGTNRNKTEEEIMSLQSKSLSIDEAKAILNETGVNKEDIIVVPISQPYSSYAYEINDEYTERVHKLFE